MSKMKWNKSDDDFIKWCELIYIYNKDKNA